ncbi:DUF3626 domain-containing protein [Paenibacillus sp. 1P07SE]|uniref:DUF3626 domain-containing protein n=1 Tax=Paenibacillus sp. 1P07SE TaxID=3132209 RepID=UPI0039A45D27
MVEQNEMAQGTTRWYGIAKRSGKEVLENMSYQLTQAQQAALDHITDYALGRESAAQQVLAEIRAMCDISDGDYREAVLSLKRHARIALHFHPDRLVHTGVTVAESLLAQGMYTNQFESGISNGSVTAYPGGQRDLWERQLFGGAYHSEVRSGGSSESRSGGSEFRSGESGDSGRLGSGGGESDESGGVGSDESDESGDLRDRDSGFDGSERPKYGALDLMLHPDGPSPRFGSCYLLLKPSVSERATFTYLDSHQLPEEKCTYRAFDGMMAAILRDAFLADFAVGERNLTPPRLIAHLRERLAAPVAERLRGQPARNLNHYVEAQVHGSVSLAEDAEALVADPSFRGTPAGAALEQLCQSYRLALHWHSGFAMDAAEVPPDFRGRAMPSLAARIAEGGRVDAARIGAAAVDVRRHPERWQDRGEPAQVLQELKLLWHVLVRFGEQASG